MEKSVESYLKVCDKKRRKRRDLGNFNLEIFKCPCIDKMNKIPENCPRSPKNPHRVRGSLMPLYRVGHPGPSEQTYATREVIMLALELGKSFTPSPFTIQTIFRYSANFQPKSTLYYLPTWQHT